MGVETLVYDSRNWIKGNKYDPRDNALIYVKSPLHTNNAFLVINSNNETEYMIPDEIRKARRKKDVINLGNRLNPFFINRFLERAIAEYEMMLRVVTRIDRDDEPFVFRLERLLDGAEFYFRKPDELAKQRLIFVTELMAQRFPFSNDLYDFVLDIELGNNDVARLRIKRYQALLEDDYRKVQELTDKIGKITLAQARGSAL